MMSILLHCSPSEFLVRIFVTINFAVQKILYIFFQAWTATRIHVSTKAINLRWRKNE